MGKNVGSRMLDILVLREKGYKRETRIINILLFIKTTVWKVSGSLITNKMSARHLSSGAYPTVCAYKHSCQSGLIITTTSLFQTLSSAFRCCVSLYQCLKFYL